MVTVMVRVGVMELKTCCSTGLPKYILLKVYISHSIED